MSLLRLLLPSRRKTPDIDRLQEKRDIAGLLRALECDERVFLDRTTTYRHRAITALGDLQATEALEPLLAALKSGDVETQKTAVRALGRLGDRRAVPELIAGLANPELEFACIGALEMLPDPRAAEPLLRALRVLCDRKDDLGAAWVEHALTAIGDAAIEPIEKMIVEETQPDEFLFRAMQAVGLMQSPAASAMLIRTLKDTRDYVRQYAAMYLRNFSDPASAKPLIEAMATGGYSRKEARETLTELGRSHRSCVDALREALTHSDSGVRSDATEILTEVGELTSPPAPEDTANRPFSRDHWLERWIASDDLDFGRMSAEILHLTRRERQICWIRAAEAFLRNGNPPASLRAYVEVVAQDPAGTDNVSWSWIAAAFRSPDERGWIHTNEFSHQVGLDWVSLNPAQEGVAELQRALADLPHRPRPGDDVAKTAELIDRIRGVV